MFLAPGIDPAMSTAQDADLLVFSLITLAILPDEARELVLRLARNVRVHRGKVAFDSNYRPALWESVESARWWRDRAAEVANFGLPSLEDEQRLGPAADADEVREHWLKCGCEEVVVKLGSAGAMLPDGTVTGPEVQLHALDTSGAGDAFDAGYLGARLRGASPQQAAMHGQRLAGWTVMRQGAIPERDHAAPYAAMAASNGLAASGAD
jgi:2-dehydro-3-deoxygluconokinase